MKKKRKVVKKMKPRVQHAPFDFGKRFRNEKGLSVSAPSMQIDTNAVNYDPIPKKIEPQILQKYTNKK